jgi:hypothetical protein
VGNLLGRSARLIKNWKLLNKQEVAEGLERVVQELEARSIRALRLAWGRNSASSPDTDPGRAHRENVPVVRNVVDTDVMDNDLGGTLNNA